MSAGTAAFICAFSYFPSFAQGFGHNPYSGVPASGVEALEWGLDWLQSDTDIGAAGDPAAVLLLFEHEAARFFDLTFMAGQVVGPAYWHMNVLQRAHLQNRLRDELFGLLAYRIGMFATSPPAVMPKMPQPTGMTSIAFGADLYHPGGPTFSMWFHMHLTPDGWRVYDINTNGRSAIIELRAMIFAQPGYPPFAW